MAFISNPGGLNASFPHLTCVLESGRSHGRVPFRRNSAIFSLSLWARTIVRGIHSSVSLVAYPNIRPCGRSNQRSGEQMKQTSYIWLKSSNSNKPGPQLLRPPLFDSGEHLEQCQGTAAPEPPAHCRSCSQNLQETTN